MQQPKPSLPSDRQTGLLPPPSAQHDTLDVREFGRTLFFYRRMILGITASAVIAMLLYAMLSPAAYQATATLQIEREPSKIGTLDLPTSSDIRDTRDYYQTQFELLQSRKVASQVIDDLRLLETLPSHSFTERLKLWFGFMQAEDRRGNIEDLLLDHLRIEPIKNSRLVAVQYTASDAKTAAEYANAFVSAFVDMNAKKQHGLMDNALAGARLTLNDTEYQQLKLAADTLPNNISIVDQAVEPHSQKKTKLLILLLLGAIVGLLLGMATALLRDFFKNTVRDVKRLEHETQLPVLATIPETLAPAPGILAVQVARNTRSVFTEAFRSLRTALRFQMPNKPTSNTLLITSSCAGEGKTTISCNLACTYAQAGYRVVLLDTDLRNPSVHKLLNLTNQIGLSDYLAHELHTTDIIQPTTIGNLYAISAGHPPQDPTEALSSAAMQQLMTQLQAEYDYVILDTPPILGLTDSLLLTLCVENVLVVVRANQTRLDSVQQGLRQLWQAHAPISGLVLNSADATAHHYYHYPETNPHETQSNTASLLSILRKNSQNWLKRMLG